MKRTVFAVLAAVVLVFLASAVVLAGCGDDTTITTAPSGPGTTGGTETTAAPEKPTKDKIVIGQAVSLSGINALGVKITSGPVYQMWVDEVNADGGIYVEEYGKKLPIELVQYDDKSDIATMTQLLEKLMVEDKVDFVLPPWSTGFLFAAAPIANKHEYILLGGAGGAIKLKEIMPELPYFFQVLNFADTQMPALADILVELGVKSAAILFIEDLHGVEYSGVAVPAFAAKGIDVKMVKSYPLGIKDLAPILKEAQNLGAEAFIGFTYPDETFMVTGQAIELGYNFKVFYANVGTFSPAYRDQFGTPVVEGTMGGGAYNAKSGPGVADFIERFTAKFDTEPDYWGAAYYWASLQHFQQSIEKAGTLDQAKIRDVMETSTFDTILGPFKYEGRFFRDHPGEIGQWQKGVFEVIDPGAKRTAPPILKPAWPAK